MKSILNINQMKINLIDAAFYFYLIQKKNMQILIIIIKDIKYTFAEKIRFNLNILLLLKFHDYLNVFNQK